MIPAELLKTLQRLALLAGLFAAVIAIVNFYESKESKLVEEVVVKINPLGVSDFLIKESDVRKLINRSFGFDMEGQAIGMIDVERMERVLENEPFVLNADVFIDASGKLHLHLDQREPLIRIIDNKGGNYFLDVNGVKFPLSAHFSPRVLVATGDIQPFTPDYRERKKHTLQELYALAHRLRSDEFLQAMIEQVHVREGNLVLIPKIGNHKIFFGHYELVDDKLKRLGLFYQEALPYEGWRKYKSIDLRYRGQVVCQRW